MSVGAYDALVGNYYSILLFVAIFFEASGWVIVLADVKARYPVRILYGVVAGWFDYTTVIVPGHWQAVSLLWPIALGMIGIEVALFLIIDRGFILILALIVSVLAFIAGIVWLLLYAAVSVILVDWYGILSAIAAILIQIVSIWTIFYALDRTETRIIAGTGLRGELWMFAFAFVNLQGWIPQNAGSESFLFFLVVLFVLPAGAFVAGFWIQWIFTARA